MNQNAIWTTSVCEYLAAKIPFELKGKKDRIWGGGGVYDFMGSFILVMTSESDVEMRVLCWHLWLHEEPLTSIEPFHFKRVLYGR